MAEASTDLRYEPPLTRGYIGSSLARRAISGKLQG